MKSFVISLCFALANPVTQNLAQAQQPNVIAYGFLSEIEFPLIRFDDDANDLWAFEPANLMSVRNDDCVQQTKELVDPLQRIVPKTMKWFEDSNVFDKEKILGANEVFDKYERSSGVKLKGIVGLREVYDYVVEFDSRNRIFYILDKMPDRNDRRKSFAMDLSNNRLSTKAAVIKEEVLMEVSFSSALDLMIPEEWLPILNAGQEAYVEKIKVEVASSAGASTFRDRVNVLPITKLGGIELKQVGVVLGDRAIGRSFWLRHHAFFDFPGFTISLYEETTNYQRFVANPLRLFRINSEAQVSLERIDRSGILASKFEAKDLLAKINGEPIGGKLGWEIYNRLEEQFLSGRGKFTLIRNGMEVEIDTPGLSPGEKQELEAVRFSGKGRFLPAPGTPR